MRKFSGDPILDARRRERQQMTAQQPKCHCGNCLSLNNTSGLCGSCERLAEEPTLEKLLARIEALEDRVETLEAAMERKGAT